MFRQAKWDEPLIFELSKRSRMGHIPPEVDRSIKEEVGDVEKLFPRRMLRKELNLPEVSEVDVVRHYTRLSQMNYGVDSGTYPLGSCTMKYNPKINEELSQNEKLAYLHPLQSEKTVQGVLKLLYNLERWLCALTGMDKFTLQPAAGAHGELVGCLIIRAHLQHIGEAQRDEMLIPSSAHGTNPASASMAGFKVVEIPADGRGLLDKEALRKALSNKTAGIMITNPNTLGLFEEDILEINDMVHEAGGLCYYDGANLNGIIGLLRPGDLNFDIVHLNLHKTFSTPHGGGGPGAGPVGVKRFLEKYLPVPTIEFDGKRYYLDYNKPLSIGKVKAFHGNIAVLLKAAAYIYLMGDYWLREAAKVAVLNTNYFVKLVKGVMGADLAYASEKHPPKNECVLSLAKLLKETGVRALDVSKSLLDFGLHAPTNYFPLIVEECLQIEFTESESLENLRTYASALKEIADKAYKDPEYVKRSPRNTSRGRLDEARANHPKTICLSWRMFLRKFKQGDSGERDG